MMFLGARKFARLSHKSAVDKITASVRILQTFPTQISHEWKSQSVESSESTRNFLLPEETRKKFAGELETAWSGIAKELSKDKIYGNIFPNIVDLIDLIDPTPEQLILLKESLTEQISRFLTDDNITALGGLIDTVISIEKFRVRISSPKPSAIKQLIQKTIGDSENLEISSQSFLSRAEISMILNSAVDCLARVAKSQTLDLLSFAHSTSSVSELLLMHSEFYVNDLLRDGGVSADGKDLELILEAREKLSASVVSVLDAVSDRIASAEIPGSPQDQIKKVVNPKIVTHILHAVSNVTDSDGMFCLLRGLSQSPSSISNAWNFVQPKHSSIDRRILEKAEILAKAVLVGMPDLLSVEDSATMAEAFAFAKIGNPQVYEFLISRLRDHSVELTPLETLQKIRSVGIALKIDNPVVFSGLSETAREYLSYVKEIEADENHPEIPSGSKRISSDPRYSACAMISIGDWTRNFQVSRSNLPSQFSWDLKVMLSTEFSAPIEPANEGPYYLPIADSQKRVTWSVNEQISRDYLRLVRHLEGSGWSIRKFREQDWSGEYDQKVSFIRKDLIQAKLLVL